MNIIDTNLKFKQMDTRKSTERIIMHHAAAKTCSAEDIHRWHLNKGWSGAGYHFLVRKDGKICDWEYLIFEKPQEENLLVENLLVENQQVENHTQLNNKELNNKELNTKNNIYGEVVDYLNRKANTNYKSSSRDTQKHINARVTEGFTVDDFKTVIDKQCAKWIGTEWEQYLRPKTLFGTKFEDYLNSKVNNNQSNQLKKKEFNFIPTGVAESGEEYMEIDGKWFNRYGKELNSKGYEIIDFGLSKGW